MIKTFGMNKDRLKYQDILDKLLLSKSLNDKEKEIVDNNPDILNDLKELKLMKAGLTKVHLEEKLNLLSDFERREYKKPSNKKRAIPAILFSSILSFLILGYLFYKATNKAIDVSQHFTPYPIAISNDFIEEDLEDAYKFYNDAVYNEAVPIFDSHLKKVSSNRNLFYYGVSLIGSGNSIKAIDVLNNPKLLADNTYPSNFYLGLAYLESDQDKARIHLERSTDFNPEIHKQAKHLLSIIK